MTNSLILKQNSELAAGKLLNKYEIISPDMIMLEAISELENITLYEGKLDGMEARLVRKANKGIIRVKEGIRELGRKRFAIAHELGHWILHVDDCQLFPCTTNHLNDYKNSKIEIEANYFAASLLMPFNFFSEDMQNKEYSFDTIKVLSEIYSTSLTATCRRFVDLSKDYFAVVMSENGIIKWWHGSGLFAEHLYIDAGSSLSQYTVAYDFFRNPDLGIGEKKAEVSIDAWCSMNSVSGISYCIEETIYMKEYNSTLSLISLP